MEIIFDSRKTGAFTAPKVLDRGVLHDENGCRCRVPGQAECSLFSDSRIAHYDAQNLGAIPLSPDPSVDFSTGKRQIPMLDLSSGVRNRLVINAGECCYSPWAWLTCGMKWCSMFCPHPRMEAILYGVFLRAAVVSVHHRIRHPL
jgi:hypothetical protein